MSKAIKWIIGLILTAGIGAVGYSLFAPAGDPGARRPVTAGFKGKGKGRGQARDAVPVFTALARTADVPVRIEGLGTARALNTVTVQPLVDGRLLSINFREGQDVKRGDLLAKIDPAIYEAQLKQALAKKAQDEAQLADARREFERNSNVGPIASLKKNIDTSRGKVEQFEALVNADQAAIDLAQTQLSYTSVVAPISGRTGIRMVDEGNIVRASATGGIVVITEVQPIAVLFNLPQQQLGSINAALAKAPASIGIPVEAIGPDGRTIVDRGTLRVIDNQVDQTTGTIRLKAEFPNTQLQLWPGQFISVRLLIDTLRSVVVVPAAAIQQGPSGPYVFVVTPEEKVAQRQIKITLQDEHRAAIGTGVSAGEQIVTSSFSRLREDTAVAATLSALPPETDDGEDGPKAQPLPATSPDETRKDGPRGAAKGRRRETGAAPAGEKSP